MRAKRFSAEQIVAKLREAEKLQAQGLTIPQLCKRLGISDQTFYRWRIKYGALKEDEAQRLKALEQENSRLKKIVAEQALDTLFGSSDNQRAVTAGEQAAKLLLNVYVSIEAGEAHHVAAQNTQGWLGGEVPTRHAREPPAAESFRVSAACQPRPRASKRAIARSASASSARTSASARSAKGSR